MNFTMDPKGFRRAGLITVFKNIVEKQRTWNSVMYTIRIKRWN